MFEEQRPRDINLCIGISNAEESERQFLPIYDSGGCSTFDMGIAEGENLDTKSGCNLKAVMTLGEVYRTYCHPCQQIHFCKIDVEGYERKVLEGIDDWNAFRPWVFVLEATKPSTLIPSHEAWEQILLDNGYMYAYHFGVNRYYIDCRKEHLMERAKKIDEFFRDNEVTHLRMHGRPAKKLRENVAVVGLGEEFENNKYRIIQRSHVIACTDSNRVPKEEFWRKCFVKPDEICKYDADKYLICTHKYFDEISEQLIKSGIEPLKIIDIDGLRFDKL